MRKVKNPRYSWLEVPPVCAMPWSDRCDEIMRLIDQLPYTAMCREVRHMARNKYLGLVRVGHVYAFCFGDSMDGFEDWRVGQSTAIGKRLSDHARDQRYSDLRAIHISRPYLQIQRERRFGELLDVNGAALFLNGAEAELLNECRARYRRVDVGKDAFRVPSRQYGFVPPWGGWYQVYGRGGDHLLRA